MASPTRSNKRRRAGQPPSTGLVQQHLPLVLTAAVFVIVFAQLLAVSKFDAVTARAILSSAGPTQVVLGTLVNSLPLMLGLVAITLPTLLRMRGRGTGQYAHVVWALALLLTVTVTYFAVFVGLYSLPWALFGISLGNALFLGLVVELDLRRKIAKDPTGQLAQRPWQVEDVALAVLILVNLLLVAGGQPWLPAERIELREDEPVVGYVLDESNDGLVVLENEDRQVMRIDHSEVESREICRVTTPAVNRHTYDPCPD